MTFFEILAQFVVDTAPSSIAADVLSAATESFVDTVGVMFAGRDEPITRIVLSLLENRASNGSWLVTGGGAAPAEAAFVNATAAHAIDFDDATTIDLSGHVSAILVPVALAVGQAQHCPGRDALAAYALGYEIEMAIAKILNPWHFDRGFHPSATIGVFGATAVTARLFGATIGETSTAFAIAASLASGIKANFGTMTKPLQVARAAQNGLLAVALAKAGQTANPAAFEDRLGFANAYAGPDWPQLIPTAVAGLGNPWALADPGVDLRKLWPVCGSVVTTIEASIEIHNMSEFDASRIGSVVVGIHARRVPQVDRAHPLTGQDARYSAQYAAAVSLLRGEPTGDDFRDEALDDQKILTLLGKTRLVADRVQTSRTKALDGHDLGARVSVRMVDGSVHDVVVDDPIGSPRNPASPERLRNKFLSATVPVVGIDAAVQLHDALVSLVGSPDLAALPGLQFDSSAFDNVQLGDA